MHDMKLQLLLLLLLLAAVSAKQLKMYMCQQSTTGWNGVCNRAYDGNTNQDYGKQGCTHTGDQGAEWWQAHLTQYSRVRSVRIINRENYRDRLNHFVIKVDGIECARYDSQSSFSNKTFECAAEGNVIRIEQLRSKTPLTLCEVEVFGDEIERPAKQLKMYMCQQSTTKTKWNGVCNRAYDGNTNQDYGKQGCTHTEDQGAEWWQAHLTQYSRVRSVRIFNRQDCCNDRLNHFVIKVDGKECARYDSDTSFSKKTFECAAEGNVIRIEQLRSKTPLTLCEVEVSGYEIQPTGDKLKFIKCQQSSVAKATGGQCNKAIDGRWSQDYQQGFCTHTGDVGNQWWQGQLEEFARITAVRIFNRQDCCSDRLNNFVIKVDGEEIARYESVQSFSIMTFPSSTEGSVLRIEQLKSNVPLTLCEVEVFGEKVVPAGNQLYITGCAQSSKPGLGSCSMAKDGNTRQTNSQNWCSFTNQEVKPWLSFDVKPSYITAVRIFNAVDAGTSSSFVISVDDSCPCAVQDSEVPFSIKTFKCAQEILGSVVMIRSSAKSPVTLRFCEVEIFGRKYD